MVEAEFRKKKGGKGLAILSGRDLFEYKKELFNDDNLKDESGDILNSVNETTEAAVEEVAAKVQSDLFLEGDDDDLDNLDDE